MMACACSLIASKLAMDGAWKRTTTRVSQWDQLGGDVRRRQTASSSDGQITGTSSQRWRSTRRTIAELAHEGLPTTYSV
jgi:hypothetical protein